MSFLTKLGSALRDIDLADPDLACDESALNACLEEYARKADTKRTYEKCVRKLFLWWCMRDRNRYTSLAQMQRVDIDAFRAWLANPPAHLVGRSTADGYKPFAAPMSSAAIRQTLIILQAIFDQLELLDHIPQNVFRLVKDKGAPARRPRRRAPRFSDMLVASQWVLTADARAAGVSPRDALIWLWVYWMAARRHEIEHAVLADVFFDTGADGSRRWRWALRGKGDKDAALPIAKLALEGLAHHLECTVDMLDATLRMHPHAPLTASTRSTLGSRRGLTGSGVYRVLLKVNSIVAAHAGIPAEAAEALRAATPHAARAFRTTHLYALHVHERHIQRFLRHSAVGTTRSYDETSDDSFHDEVIASTREP
jgi:integrase